MNKYLKLASILLLGTAVIYGAHSLVLDSFGLNEYWGQVSYTLTGLYVFGFLFSLVTAVLLHLTDFAMAKYLSFVFLGCVFLRAVASYLYIKDGLGYFENDFLELNFIVTFFIFLVFDIFVAYKLVNQVVKKESV